MNPDQGKTAMLGIGAAAAILLTVSLWSGRWACALADVLLIVTAYYGYKSWQRTADINDKLADLHRPRR